MRPSRPAPLRFFHPRQVTVMTWPERSWWLLGSRPAPARPRTQGCLAFPPRSLVYWVAGCFVCAETLPLSLASHPPPPPPPCRPLAVLETEKGERERKLNFRCGSSAETLPVISGEGGAGRAGGQDALQGPEVTPPHSLPQLPPKGS